MTKPFIDQPAECFAELIADFSGRPGVTVPGADGRRGFGSSALRINGAIFAMISRRELVLKLPGDTVAALIDRGQGEPFAAGKRTPMRQWLVVDVAVAPWRQLADEAFDFVASGTPAP
jgi:TfoX N-terminal domain